MPREIRTIKRSFFTDERVTSVPREVRLTFLGLLVNADDYGRLRADPRLLKAAIYPLDDDITSHHVASDIASLERIGLVRRYVVRECPYLEIGNFAKHQVMNRKYKSDIPEPAIECERTADALPTHCAHTVGAERSGEGAEKERSGEPVAPPVIAVAEESHFRPPQPSDLTELPASLFEALPREAKSLLTQFYDFPAATFTQRKRYKAVALQLIDALDPKHPGPKVSGGQRAKARSAEHLADVCRAVAKDPPMDRDLVIVWVLKKLLDPPKGPSVTEVAKRREAEELAESDRYHLEAHAAGVRWAKENPEEYAPILAEVEATFRGKQGIFAEQGRSGMLTQRCARAAGFPQFSEWSAAQEQPA